MITENTFKWLNPNISSTTVPELFLLNGIVQDAKWHPEIDTGVHIELCVAAANLLGVSTPVKYAVLFHDLGKALTPKKILPAHHSHEELGRVPTLNACKTLGLDAYTSKLCEFVTTYHLLVHTFTSLSPKRIITFVEDLNTAGLNVHDVTAACVCDKLGRGSGFNNQSFKDYLSAENCQKADYSLLNNYKSAFMLIEAVGVLAQIPNNFNKGDLDWDDSHKQRIAAIGQLKQKYNEKVD